MTDDPQSTDPQIPRGPRPFVIEVEAEADPSLAPPVPDGLPDGRAMRLAAAAVRPRASGLWRFTLWAVGAALSFVLSVAAWDFITNLIARNAVLGGAAAVLIGVAVLSLLLLAAREVLAFSRLARLDHLRSAAEAARSDLKSAKRIVAAVMALYAGRPLLAAGRDRVLTRQDEVFDADALIALAEREVLAPLDALARAEVEAAARQVATVTAIVPLALADVAAALFSNLRMIRRIAEIYGGRSGSFGSLGLLRRVFSSLIATGALALTDDLIGSVAGGGVLSKLSRRFGEGVVNGALTARVGIAAMELCRPLPFIALERPGVSATLSRALTGMFGRGEAG